VISLGTAKFTKGWTSFGKVGSKHPGQSLQNVIHSKKRIYTSRYVFKNTIYKPN
jgi:hypothetical protein